METPVVTTHEISPERVCVNCGNTTRARFCDACGQHMDVKRITFSSVMREAFEKFFGFENMYIRTVWHGFVKPGDLLRSYLAGNRRRYVGPVGYFIINTAIYILILQTFDIQIDELYTQLAEDMGVGPSVEFDEKQERLSKHIYGLTTKFNRAVQMLIAFLFSIPMWLFFRKAQRINFMECIAVAVYLSAQNQLILTFWLITAKLHIPYTSLNITIVTFLLGGWYIAVLFTPKPSVPNFIKGVVANILASLLAVVLIIVVVVAGLLIFGKRFLEMMGLEYLIDQGSSLP